jgi:hypothetical protein
MSAKTKTAKKTAKTKKAAETFQVKGDELLTKVKALIKEGNVRKITIQDKDKNTLISLPLTAGVVGVVLAPVLAAVGAIAALITDCTIKVERK